MTLKTLNQIIINVFCSFRYLLTLKKISECKLINLKKEEEICPTKEPKRN